MQIAVGLTNKTIVPKGNLKAANIIVKT